MLSLCVQQQNGVRCMFEAPIGVFDSGVGGVSVLQELYALLPHEHYIYMADSGWCPYGGRAATIIRERAATLTEWLLACGAKLIVVACNTATIAAVEWLRTTYPVAFVGMEPAVKPAVYHTRSGVVGILATGAALAGEKFHHLVARYAGDVRVLTQPCPGLVEVVESGQIWSAEARALVEQYTQPLLAAGADTLVLGCTHYPFLRPLIADVVGPQIALIDTGAAVARQTARLLDQDQLRNPATKPADIRWYTSGNPHHVQQVLAQLWKTAVNVQQGPA